MDVLELANTQCFISTCGRDPNNLAYDIDLEYEGIKGKDLGTVRVVLLL
jgi:hypothetical protein